MNKAIVRFLIIGVVATAGLQAAVPDGAGAIDGRGLNPAEVLDLVSGIASAMVADVEPTGPVSSEEQTAAAVAAATAGMGALQLARQGSTMNLGDIITATTEAVAAVPAPVRRSWVARLYRSACCKNTADALTNPAVQGTLQVAMIVLGTTLVTSYLMLIPAGLLLIGGAAAKIVKRQAELDAMANGGAGARAGGYEDKKAIEAEIIAEKMAITAALLDSNEGRGYARSFNESMAMLGRPERIAYGQPIPDMLVHIIGVVVHGVRPVASAEGRRGAGAGAPSREDFAVRADWADALAKSFVPVV